MANGELIQIIRPLSFNGFKNSMRFLCNQLDIHKWGKWQYYYGEIYSLFYDKPFIGECKVRVCLRCGLKERRCA